MRSATVNRGLKQSADRAQTGRLLALAQCFQAGDGGSIPLTRSTATAAFRQVIPLVDSHYHISERLAHSRVYSVGCGTWVARLQRAAPRPTQCAGPGRGRYREMVTFCDPTGVASEAAVAARRARIDRSRAMSMRISVRFAPAVAPTIAVMSASRSAVALKPSQAPTSAPAAAAAKPAILVWPDQSRCTHAQ